MIVGTLLSLFLVGLTRRWRIRNGERMLRPARRSRLPAIHPVRLPRSIPAT